MEIGCSEHERIRHVRRQKGYTHGSTGSVSTLSTNSNVMCDIGNGIGVGVVDTTRNTEEMMPPLIENLPPGSIVTAGSNVSGRMGGDTTAKDNVETRKLNLIKVYSEGKTQVKNDNNLRTMNRALRRVILPHIKFVQGGKNFGSFEQPDFSSPDCWVNKLYETMPMLHNATDRQKAETWMTYKSKMKEQFSLHRSAITMKLKKNFQEAIRPMRNVDDEDKVKIELEDGEPLTLLVARVKDGRIEKIRTEGTVEELRLCAEMCFSTVVPREHWKNNHRKVAMSSIFTIADEALVMVMLENNIKEWIEQVVRGETKASKKRRLTKYTGGGSNKDGTKKGWTLEGKKRFNEIFDAVQLARTSNRSKTREEFLMNDWNEIAEKAGIIARAGVDGEEDVQKEMERMREEESFVPRSGLFLNGS